MGDVFVGLDFGWNDPTSVHWCIRKNKRWLVSDEFYESKVALEDLSRKLRYHPWANLVKGYFADPSAAQEKGELARYGTVMLNANNDIKLGIQRVSSLFAQRTPAPGIVIDRRCINLIRELGLYSYPNKNSRNSGEKPVDLYNHAMDSLRYAILSSENWEETEPVDELQDQRELPVWLRVYMQQRNQPQYVDAVLGNDW